MTAIRLAAGTKPIKGIAFRDSGGVLRSVKDAYLRTAAGLKHIYTTFAVSLSATEADGSTYSRTGTGRATSSAVTAIAAGANTPFTYSWARTSGSASVTATAATSATTQFSASLSAGASVTATFACTVTDGSGQVLTTGNVSVTLENASL